MDSTSGAVEGSPSSPYLCIAESAGIGRGVFAKSDFFTGDLIEISPVIVIPASEWFLIEKTVIFNYCYAFGEFDENMALAMGFGSMFNHSYSPNARYIKKVDRQVIEFYAVREIKREEEITINYNGDPNSLDPLWFSVCE